MANAQNIYAQYAKRCTRCNAQIVSICINCVQHNVSQTRSLSLELFKNSHVAEVQTICYFAAPFMSLNYFLIRSKLEIYAFMWCEQVDRQLTMTQLKSMNEIISHTESNWITVSKSIFQSPNILNCFFFLVMVFMFQFISKSLQNSCASF